MNKQTRILTAIAVAIVLGGMFAYQDAQKNEPAYQQHPVTVILTDFFCGFLAGLICYFGSGWLFRRKERKSQPSHSNMLIMSALQIQGQKNMVDFGSRLNRPLKNCNKNDVFMC
jgi:RsiW-degrading membrane proteinase PrsW (M82 family)